jgi:Ca2+-dependent lipid-binding protein
VKVWLQFGDKRIEKRKTPIFKVTLNPVFNETFSFNVPWEKIRECSLDVMVMDFDNIGRNELIGRILLAGQFQRTPVPRPGAGHAQSFTITPSTSQ